MSIFDFIRSNGNKSEGLEKKAVSGGNVIDSTAPFSNFLIGNSTPYNYNFSAKELVAKNTGWVYTCNNKNAITIASIPLKLYFLNKNNKKIERTAHRAFKGDSRKLLNQLGIRKDYQVVEIEQHPLLDLLNTINDTMNYKDFCEFVHSYLGLIGNAYVEIIKDSSGKPIELHPLISENVNVYATDGKDGKITKYIYDLGEGKKKTYAPDQILHLVNYQPSNCIVGRGELESCILAAERMKYYDMFEIALSQNNGRPDGIIFNFKNNITEKEKEDLYKRIIKRFSGVKNSGKPIITTGEMTLQNINIPPKDMQFNQGRIWGREEVASTYAVPLPLITTNDVNRANSLSAFNFYLQFNIYPKMGKYVEKLNSQLVPLYGEEGLYLWFEESYLDDPAIKAQSIIAEYTAGIIDKSEARSKLGYEPVQEGEVINEE